MNEKERILDAARIIGFDKAIRALYENEKPLKSTNDFFEYKLKENIKVKQHNNNVLIIRDESDASQIRLIKDDLDEMLSRFEEE